MPRRIDRIREAGNDELLVQERELTSRFSGCVFDCYRASGSVEALHDARKDLARVKTHLRAQELNGTAGSKNGTEKSARGQRKKQRQRLPNKQQQRLRRRPSRLRIRGTFRQDEEGREGVMTTEREGSAAEQDKRGERTVSPAR